MTIDRYPLTWPLHVPRTPAPKRIAGSFMVTSDKAMEELVKEVRLSGGTGLIISSNVPLRRDGLPYANAREPDDPGVAVYFTRKGRQVCIPCDTYDRRWKNIRAIGLSIKDMRGPEMRGCAAITDAAYTGFLALPAPGAPQAQGWWMVLGIPRPSDPTDINAAYRDRVRALMMSDTNGTNEDELQRLNVARDEGLEEAEARTAK
jgi:hypothetical protein